MITKVNNIDKKKNWEERRLGDIFFIERGGSPRPIAKYLTKSADGINWIMIGDTKGVTKYITKTNKKITQDGVKRSRMVYEGDFILSNSMSFGRPYIMKTTGCIHDGWLLLRSKEKNVDSNYLFHLLGSPLVFSQFDSLAAGSTVRNLNIDLVKSVSIPLPPLSEQKRIVAVLDESFAALAKAKENAEKNLENAREIFDIYHQEVFVGQGDWEERILGDVCAISSKLIDPKKQEFQNLLHIGAGNIESKKGTLVDIKTAKEENLISGKFLFDNNMVLYSKIRPYLEKVVRCDFTGLCSADIYPLLPFPGLMERDFLYYLLLTKNFTEYAIQGSQRAGMPKVNREHLFQYTFQLPSVTIQKYIVSKLDALSVETNKLEAIYQQKLTDLEELKKSLLNKAFNGELV